MATHTGVSQAVRITIPAGYPNATYPIALGFVDGDSELEEGEGTLGVFVQGAAPLEDVTFALNDGTSWIDVATVTSDVNGDVGPVDIFIPYPGVTGSLPFRATSASHGTDERTIVIGGFAGGTADPGVDAPPVLITGSTGRWVLQDLQPAGLGSWVMPVNPTSMSNPHLTKVALVRSTTSPRTGKRHVSESSVEVAPWTLAGYCPDEEFHTKLKAYAALNRRIYVIDHRGRAWKCAITSLDITPRKRQILDDGSPQDWAADWRMALDIVDQTFVLPT